MPPLSSNPTEAAEFIRAALDARTSWVFLTDAPPVSRVLEGVRNVLAFHGVPDSSLGFASFRHLDPFNRRLAEVTIAVLPKARVSEKFVRRILSEFGVAPAPATLADRDILPIGYDPEMLGSILAAILAGKIQAISSLAVN